MKNEINEINEAIIKTSQKNSTKIHLVLKDGSWRNGIVISANDSFFTFSDKINGNEDLFYIQVKSVSPYREVEKW